MNPAHIIRIVGFIAVLAIGLIPGVPMGGLVLGILGLAVGWFVKKEDRVGVLIMAIFLVVGSEALNDVPAIGPYVTNILASAGSLVGAASVTVLAMITLDSIKN